jgi:hypothetical protein
VAARRLSPRLCTAWWRPNRKLGAAETAGGVPLVQGAAAAALDVRQLGEHETAVHQPVHHPSYAAA